MSEGKMAPYRRSSFSGEGHTGSLLFDQHRCAHKHEGDATAKPGSKSTPASDTEHIEQFDLHI